MPTTTIHKFCSHLSASDHCIVTPTVTHCTVLIFAAVLQYRNVLLSTQYLQLQQPYYDVLYHTFTQRKSPKCSLGTYPLAKVEQLSPATAFRDWETRVLASGSCEVLRIVSYITVPTALEGVGLFSVAPLSPLFCKLCPTECAKGLGSGARRQSRHYFRICSM